MFTFMFVDFCRKKIGKKSLVTAWSHLPS